MSSPAADARGQAKEGAQMMPSVGWARARAGYRGHHAALASPPSPVSPQPPARLVVLGDSPGARGTKGQEGGRVRQQLPVEAKEERKGEEGGAVITDT